MSNKEILENNKLIANFMGVKIGEERYSYRIGVTEPLQEKHLNYNNSWGWLMPVIEKIESDNIMATVVIICNKCQITLFDFESVPKFAKTIQANDKLKATWLCVVEFVKRFNLQSVPDK